MEAISVLKLRPRRNDTERTKLLKEVLQSTVDLNIPSKKPGSPNIVSLAAARMEGLSLDRRPKKVNNSVPDLHACSRTDSVCAEIFNDVELSPLLRDCGRRISGMCAKLRIPDSQVLSRSGHQGRRISENNVSIVDNPRHPQSVVQAQEDRAAYAFISAQKDFFTHVDALEEKLEKSPGYKELQALFPQTVRRHPNLSLLTDVSLKDEDEFRRTIGISVCECPKEEKSFMSMSSSGAFHNAEARLNQQQRQQPPPVPKIPEMRKAQLGRPPPSTALYDRHSRLR